MVGGRTGASGLNRGIGKGEKQAALKFGVDIQEQDLRFLHTLASIKGFDFEDMVSTVIVLGCESLRQTLANEMRGEVAN